MSTSLPGSGLRTRRRALIAFPHLILTAFVVLLTASQAQARRNGFQGVCSNCHGNGAQVELTLDPDTFEPGDIVHLTAVVTGNNPQVGGIHINANGRGEFMLVNGGGVHLVGPTEVTHDSPKPAVNGAVTFMVDWQAPAEAAAVNFVARGVAANNDGNRSGDAAGETSVSKVAGCLGATFYRDYDGDGYGNATFGTVEDCSPPDGYALLDGDCNEDVAAINPGMTELCNDIDDNCNSRIDERAYPTCGIGWCRRSAQSCGEDALCIPGQPEVEVCNGLDDDCDGYIDSGDICEGGLVCHQAVCKTMDEALAIEPDFIPYEGTVEEGLIVEPSPIMSGPSVGTTDPMPLPAMSTGGTGSVAPAPSTPTPVTTPPATTSPAVTATAGQATTLTPTMTPVSSVTSDAPAASGCALSPATSRVAGSFAWLTALGLVGMFAAYRRRR